MRFAVIGAGMAGILSAIKLTQAGYTDFTVYEKGDRFGGKWRENTYPGLSCDVPSHLYSYSFALNPDWSHAYSPGPEIWAYFDRVAREHGVDKATRFGDEVTKLEWLDGRWHLETRAGVRDVVDVVIAATGVLHQPRYPDIAGVDTFNGACFHSARWDHDVDIAGKRIGIIGTGSTAVQITSAVINDVAHLSLFQRTAQWIMPQQNPAFSDEERAQFRADAEHLAGLHVRLSELFGGFSAAVIDEASPLMQNIEMLCLQNLEQNVHDPELRERLRPDYRAACKRLIVSPDFYDALQRPNADLVTEAITCIEPGGVRTADGVLHELDVLVLATGFKVDSFLRPMTVLGRDGIDLNQVWTPRPNAYLSITVPGFPNLFMLNGPNGPVGNFSLIEIAETQFAYIAQLVDLLARDAYREVCASPEAMEAFEAERVEAAKRTIWATGCRSWYLDDRGVPASWPWSLDRFRAEMSAPKLDAYDLR